MDCGFSIGIYHSK